MASRDVTLVIHSVQTLDDAQPTPPVELTVQGLLSQEGEELALTYQESGDSGMENAHTTLRVRPGQVSLLREGPWRCQMLFQEGLPHHSRYETPYGDLPLTVVTRRLRSTLKETGGTLELEYDMELGGQSAGRTRFRLTARETAPGDLCQ